MSVVPAQPPRRRRRVWVVVGVAVAIAALIAWAVMPPSRHPFDDEIARLRAAGFATTFEEWYGPMPSDEENGALVFVAAVRRLDAEHGKESSWTVTGPWDEAKEDWTTSSTAEELAALREHLETLRPFFERLDAAIAKPRFKFVTVVDASGLTTSDEVAQLLLVSRLLEAKAVSAASPAERADAIRALARLASRPEYPSLIETMVGQAMWGKACRFARDAVEKGALTASQARAALEPWPARRSIDAAGEIARGEIAWLPAACEALLDGRATWVKRPSAVERASRAFERIFRGRREDAATFEVSLTPSHAAEILRTWSELAAFRPGTHAETVAWADTASERWKAVDASMGTFLPTVTKGMVRNDAATALTRIALAACERFETTGAWPASLDDLAAEFPGGVPADPITGAPFVYELGERTVRVTTTAPVPEGEDQEREAWLRENELLWEFPR